MSESWDFAGGLLLPTAARQQAVGPCHSSGGKERGFSLQILMPG